MQNEITVSKPLLDQNGHLTEAGYAKSLILDYDRSAIKAKGFRIKEWDYYYIGNEKFGVALTIADNSYHALSSMSLLDFENNINLTKGPLSFFSFGKTNLPSTSKIGDVSASGKNVEISFKNDGKTRHLKAVQHDFYGKTFEVDVELYDEPQDSMVIATPFAKDKTAFYYNQKINCIKVKGFAKYGDKVYDFSDSNKSYAVLDWGRGVWTYKNTWFWGSLSSEVDGVPFGFNIGYGFGDTSNASENMIFYNGKAHKTDQIVFEIPQKDGKDDYMSDWKFSTNDHRLDMTFTPMMDRSATIDFKVFCSIQHQVFGKFSGTAVLDDGTKIEFSNLVGFAEKVHNKW